MKIKKKKPSKETNKKKGGGEVPLNSTTFRNKQGTWVAPLVKHPTLDFDSGHDLRVLGWSPMPDSLFSRVSAGDSPSPLYLSSLCMFSLSQINK